MNNNSNLSYPTKGQNFCTNCGNKNEVGQKFCTKCGNPIEVVKEQITKCPKCMARLNPGVRYCVNCGLDLIGTDLSVPIPKVTPYQRPNYDPIYYLNESMFIEALIRTELKEMGYDDKAHVPGVDNQKAKVTLIFAIITFLFVSLFFFHFNPMINLVYVIAVIIYLVNIKNYNLIKYLIKQVKARPDDDVSNIISSIMEPAKNYKSTSIKSIVILVVSIFLPLIIFFNPHIFYEAEGEGYYVRFYTMGLSNMTKADIPAEYKGKPVIGLRGNTFEYMTRLKEVNLPDSLKVIRGEAFKNCKSLEKIELPSNLEVLGGGAFMNCTSLKSIEIPESVKELRGETFLNCSSLESVKLPSSIPEIRGNTFENCTSLKEIYIPSTVTRIGGHAFYGNSSLSKVTFGENSQLTEIGSSAFRMCPLLSEIYIPIGTTVNERAFKESPTVVKRVNGNNVVLENYDYLSLFINEDYNVYGTNINVKLTNVEYNNGSYTYTIVFTGDIDKTVYISDQDKTYTSDDLFVEYYSGYDNYVHLNIYY